MEGVDDGCGRIDESERSGMPSHEEKSGIREASNIAWNGSALCFATRLGLLLKVVEHDDSKNAANEGSEVVRACQESP